jgi:hypothetical protein
LRESIALLRALLTEEVETLTVEVIDDHLGFIARGADDLANLELGLPRLERAAQTPDALIELLIEQVFCERPLAGGGMRERGSIWPMVSVAAGAIFVLVVVPLLLESGPIRYPNRPFQISTLPNHL